MKRFFQWDTEALIIVGLFTALSKVVSLLVALLGGGMNPVTLLLRAGLAAALLIVMVARVRRFGTLFLYTLVAQLISFLVTGGGMVSMLPFMLAGAVASDAVIALCGGYRKTASAAAGVVMYEVFGRAVTLGYAFLMSRENIARFGMIAVLVSFSLLGVLFIGIPCGIKFTRELRHAGIIREL